MLLNSLNMKRNFVLTITTFLLTFLIINTVSVNLLAEGTRQIMPSSDKQGKLCIDYSRNDFAFYDGAVDFRLNIAIREVTESIRFGFGDVEGNNTADMVFRIKDPSGNVVYGPVSVPSSGSGYIEDWNQAYNGPFPSSGGYDYMELQVSVTGNYYIEFYYPGSYTHDNKHTLEYFDITVVDGSGNEKNGRLWSEAWQFWSETPEEPPTTSRFYGKMMILSDDSIVTQVNCNGLVGGTFSISSNKTGCANTGSIIQDRMSRSGFYTYPKYKVFLNDPDSLIFPTATLKSGIIEPVTVEPNCDGSVTIGIRVVTDGIVQLLIEVNQDPGVDSEDVQIVANVLADPGGDGYNYIVWDGNDNLGDPVSNGTEVSMSASYISGLTNLPMYDIEYNDNGYIVEQIRPAGGLLEVFWDDSGIGGTYNAINGCSNTSGCHTWDSSIGENNTINTWWYVVREETTPVDFTFIRTPDELTLYGSDTWCIGTGGLGYYVDEDPNSTTYNWSYSGTGATITGIGTNITIEFSESSTEGVISVNGYNDDCGEGPATSIDISFEPLPDVFLGSYEDMCYTAAGFALTGGTPEGGTYYVDGIESDSLFPYLMDEGVHEIAYNYTASTGCSNSDTSSILLYDAPECEGTIFFPNSFTPNGDGLNDLFGPVQNNIVSFRMLIFNRWGQMIYETFDPVSGWDGSFQGHDCPMGTYVYKASYGRSLRSDDGGEQSGTVTLIR
jgi:gliding motility-associated-like protein